MGRRQGPCLVDEMAHHIAQWRPSLLGLVTMGRIWPASQGHSATTYLFVRSPRLPRFTMHRATKGHLINRKGACCVFRSCCYTPDLRSFGEIVDSIYVTHLAGGRPGRQPVQAGTDVWARHRGSPTQPPQFTLTHSNLIHRRGALARRP